MRKSKFFLRSTGLTHSVAAHSGVGRAGRCRRSFQWLTVIAIFAILFYGNIEVSAMQSHVSQPGGLILEATPATITTSNGTFAPDNPPDAGTGLRLIEATPTTMTTPDSTPTPDGTPTPVSTSGTSTSLRPFIDSWNNIHLFQVFDNKINNPTSIAGNYDFVWGADSSMVAAWRAGNPNIFLTYYIPFSRDPDSTHDLNYWKTNHPDWILYQCDRVTPAYQYGDPNMPLDFSNPDVVSWQVQNSGQFASSKGFDGIAADNVDMDNYYGACGVYKNGQWVQLYTGQPDDPQWRTNIVSWLTGMQQALHQLQPPLALIPNLGFGSLAPTDPFLQQIVNNVDGILDEGGFTNYGSGDLTDDAWAQRVKFIESVQSQQKAYYVINQFSSVGSNELEWAIASYLMVKEHSDGLYISQVQQYGADNRYNEYSDQIGTPLGAMYQAQSVYWRDYSSGESIVNPSSSNTYTVTLSAGKNYTDLEGNAIGPSVTLSPHSGIVLITTSLKHSH